MKSWESDLYIFNAENLSLMICRISEPVLSFSKYSPLCLSLHVSGRRGINRFASRRSLPSQDTVNESKLPRFIRRQHLQEDSSKKHVQQITSRTRAQSPSLSPRVPPTHRSRHYDPSNEVPKENMRLLEPHVLSRRLKTLCESNNNVNEAVTMLKNAPLDAQNTQVWNTLIWQALKLQRFQLSYELFIDVSILRGFLN
jgi:hypothetical protein